MSNTSKEKQERKVVHLQMGEHHEYFGSIEQLFASTTKLYWGLAYIKYETILNVWVL